MTPPTPINLDLVELRCRLRGWQSERKGATLVVWPTDQTTAIYGAGADHPIWPGGTPHAEPWAVELARPRLTLADIIADPGEGWTVGPEDKESPDGGHRFGWRAQHGSYFLMHGALVVRTADGSVLDAIGCASQGADRIAAHRAVTDLLIRLAEVSDV